MSSPQRIQPLPLHLANQIAAGEVIERPASVVKELVENSIDAGADQIHIDIEGAGSHLIRVRDNGQGIHHDDLTLALSRHATSKLQTSEQLSHIASLGFRGEALPSIASVSQLTLISRQSDSEIAWQVNNEQQAPEPIAHPIGTSLEVRELFFNVPARKHFLRGDKTELNHINTTLSRLALSQFEIGFSYQLGQQGIVKLAIAHTLQQQQQRIAKLCGNAFIKHSHYFEQQFDDIELKGWLGKVQAHRPQTDVQYFFINGRVIRDRVINHAIRQAYADAIPAGRHPSFVLYLNLPLDKLDINVHPTKHEVRFRDARLIHGLITKAIEDTLLSAPTIPDTQVSLALEKQQESDQVKDTAASYPNNLQTNQSTLADYQSIQLLHQRYLISQIENQIWLIDLHQANRDLLRKQFIDAVESKQLRSRPILVPIKVALEHTQLTAMAQHQALLAELGLTVSLQQSELTITAIPSLLTHCDVIELITAVANSLTINAHSKQALIALLLQHIPSIPISSPEQAHTILKQLPAPTEQLNWCRRLDQSTLSGLF